MTFSEWQTWVFLGALAFLAYDHFQLRRTVTSNEVALEKMRTHVAENYVRSEAVVRLGDELTNLRHTVEEAVKLLHEIKGSQTPR